MLPLVLSRLELVEDEAASTRMLAEAAMLILTRPGTGGLPAPSVQLCALFRAHFVTELLDDVRSIRGYKVSFLSSHLNPNRSCFTLQHDHIILTDLMPPGYLIIHLPSPRIPNRSCLTLASGAGRRCAAAVLMHSAPTMPANGRCCCCCPRRK
jgi:hypothetical protein